MPRVKRGPRARRRRKKILKAARGFVGGRSAQYKQAKQTLHRAWAYAYRDRKQRKRDFRRLWIARINAAARTNDFTYSKLMGGLNKANIALDRKVLAEMAIFDPAGFTKVVEAARKAFS